MNTVNHIANPYKVKPNAVLRMRGRGLFIFLMDSDFLFSVEERKERLP